MPLALAGLAGCKASDPVHHPDGEVDAAPPAALDPPMLEATPTSTPLGTVTVRGSTDGSRVVSQGSPDGALVTTPLPGGSFCQDTPIATDGTTELRFYALSGDGRISDPVTVTVSHDASAPVPSGGTCDESSIVCADSENCSQTGDEDCNGFADQCDLACNSCKDDIYEPNDLPINVPTLTAGTYNELKLCPCHDDWFAWQVDVNTRIHAVANFGTDIDIDMKLFRAGMDGSGTDGDALQTSSGSGQSEQIDWTSDMPGTYFVRIYPYLEDSGSERPQGSYSLTVD